MKRKRNKGKKGKKYFPPTANTLTRYKQHTAFPSNKHKPNRINRRRRTSCGCMARQRGSHGFCAQHWIGHPLVSFLPRYRVGIPQLAHNLGWCSGRGSSTGMNTNLFPHIWQTGPRQCHSNYWHGAGASVGAMWWRREPCCSRRLRPVRFL